jgi:hypothetical protein
MNNQAKNNAEHGYQNEIFATSSSRKKTRRTRVWLKKKDLFGYKNTHKHVE